MIRLWALALNTFREAVRDRVLHSILFFGAAAVILSIIFKDITIGDQAKVVRSVAHSGVDLFASLIAMFLGISLLWKELEKKTIYTILSKPIPRWMFVLGKYLGLILTVGVELLLLVGLYTVAMGLYQGVPSLTALVSLYFANFFAHLGRLYFLHILSHDSVCLHSFILTMGTWPMTFGFMALC